MTKTDFRTYGIFLSAALLLILSSCARPEFETKTSFIKPVSAQGLQCVQQAAQTQQSCDQRLKGPYQSCYARATDRAERGYQDALAHYTADKRDYDRCMEEAEYLWQREVDQLHYELVDRVQANNAACGFQVPNAVFRYPDAGRSTIRSPGTTICPACARPVPVTRRRWRIS